MIIHHETIISNDLIKLFKKEVYEPMVAEIMNLSVKVFPEEYLYNKEQPCGECDFISLNSKRKFDAKLPFEHEQIELLTSGKKHSPLIKEWITELQQEASDFSPIKMREDPNYSVSTTKLYSIIEKQLKRDKPDEDLVFFIPFPIVLYSNEETFNAKFLNSASNFLNQIYETLKSTDILNERKIYVILPASQKHTLALVDLELREVEFIVYEKLSQYISYQEV